MHLTVTSSDSDILSNSLLIIELTNNTLWLHIAINNYNYGVLVGRASVGRAPRISSHGTHGHTVPYTVLYIGCRCKWKATTVYSWYMNSYLSDMSRWHHPACWLVHFDLYYISNREHVNVIVEWNTVQCCIVILP